MKRRNFLSALGIGGAIAAATTPAAAATPSTEKRNLKWAHIQIEKGYRVRLESWALPENPSIEHGPAVLTFKGGTPQGVASVKHLVATVEILEGPWEIVPAEDMPKPPSVQRSSLGNAGGSFKITCGNNPLTRGDVILTAGDGKAKFHMTGTTV